MNFTGSGTVRVASAFEYKTSWYSHSHGLIRIFVATINSCQNVAENFNLISIYTKVTQLIGNLYIYYFLYTYIKIFVFISSF